MKYRITLVILAFSLLLCNQSFAQDNLQGSKTVTSVFKALKKQNEKKFLKRLPTKKDIEYLIPLIKEARPEEKIPEVDSVIANFKTDASENFIKVIKKGENLGINWNTIILKDVRSKSNPDHRINVERRDIILECTSGDKTFIITLKKTYYIRNKWRLMNTMKLQLL
ncbi:hypothetical protein [Winogradskyella rapida]|uniref:Uncharacterized protein n=1 Tax=Winogradskyella rapida TaxID=549701 RepID=A0ABW3KQ39_9FLAO